MVCLHYGIDTAEYTIRRAAADLIVKIDEKVAELTQGKDQNQFAEIDQWIAAHEDEFREDLDDIDEDETNGNNSQIVSIK